jgi:hypothetical protein
MMVIYCKAGSRQWNGFVQSISRYQVEVLGKTELQADFSLKLMKAESDPEEQARQDWTGIDAILRVIFGTFKDEGLPRTYQQKKGSTAFCRKPLKFMVPRDGIEPPTRGFSVFFFAFFTGNFRKLSDTKNTP